MTYTWRGIQTPSTERLRLTTGDRIHARSAVDVGAHHYDYVVELDSEWTFRTLEISCRDGRRLRLRRNDGGAWSVDDEPRPDLAEAVDIDLSFSPFTNTLPIRRLSLALGSSAEITTAYVDVPTLLVTPDPQRYTRTGARRHLYESLDSDFVREITVDADGFVVDYPSLFARVADAEHTT